MCGTGLRYVSALLATRILGASAFGSYTLARTLVSILSQLSAIGLSPGLLPFLVKARQDDDQPRIRALIRSSWVLVTLASGTLAALTWLLAPWLAENVFEDEALTRILRPLSILIVVTALTTVSLVVVQAFNAVRAQAWIDLVLGVLLTVVGLVVTWWLDYGLVGVIASTLAGPPLGLLLSLRLNARFVPGVFERGAPSTPLTIRSLAAGSLPLMGASMMAMSVLWMDVVLMGIFREPYEVGIYVACAQLVPTILIVRQATVPAFSVRFSELHVHGNWSEIRRLYQSTSQWSMWWALVVGSTLVIWGPEILALFGDEFVAGTTVLAVLAISRMLGATSGLGTRMLMLAGKGSLVFWSAAAIIASNIILDVIWIPEYGGIGAASATCLCLALGAILKVGHVWYYYRITPFSRRSLIALFSTAVSAGVAYAFRTGPDWPFGWLVPLTGFVLACTVAYWSWGMGAEDREAFAAARRRLRR